MSKQQQSRSKSAFRGFIGYTAKVIQLYQGSTVTNPEEMQNVLSEAAAMIDDTRVEMYDAVLFSRAKNVERWDDDFRSRAAYAVDKIRESLQEQLDRSIDEDEKAFREAAAAFGTDVETYAQFLQWDKPGIVASAATNEERKTAYTDLKDVLRVYTKIAFAVIHVRYWKGFYYLAVGDSGGRRRQSRRKSRQKKSKKTIRF